MGSVTYQTKVPASLTDFCEEMAALFSEVEHNLYRALQKGENPSALKREYQQRYQINARQFNAIYFGIKGKISSREECHKQQLEGLKDRIEGIEKRITKLEKRLEKARASCPCGKRRFGYRKHIQFQIHHKKRKLGGLKAKLLRLQNTQPSVIFGSRKLWEAQFNLEANGYSTHSEWLKDWRAARANQFSFVGSSDETSGCQICQLSPEGTMLIKVPHSLEARFGEYVPAKRGIYIIATNIKFPYGQEDIDYALAKGQSMTYRFVRKDNQWYLFATTDRYEVPIQTSRENGCLGIDLNPGVVGWSYCDSSGNLKGYGQIQISLQDRSTYQTQATLGDAVKQLVDIASHYNCPISVENLDFSKKKASMKEHGVRYSRMLSNFCYSKFFELLNSRANRYGVELIKVNPAYSSQIGLVKFMSLYGMSSDTAAALVLARRALKHSERLPEGGSAGEASPADTPPNYARFGQRKRSNLWPPSSEGGWGLAQKKRHVWSFWGALGKNVLGAYEKLNRRLRRHDYFHNRTAPSRVVVTLLEVQASGGKSKSKTRRKTKPQTKTLPLAGEIPASRIVNSTVRLT